MLYLIKNPVRAAKEAKNISESQIHGMLELLREKGIDIVVMSGVDDPVFPMGKLQATIKDGVASGKLDGFLSLRGGHGEIGNLPEHFMVLAEKMLTACEKKRKVKS